MQERGKKSLSNLVAATSVCLNDETFSHQQHLYNQSTLLLLRSERVKTFWKLTITVQWTETLN
jgi:hypothetical protein